MKKETKAKRLERIKKQKEPLSVIEDIKKYAKSGEMVDDETMDRLKWYGIYAHSKASNDELKSYYMMRIKLVNGKLNIKQIQTIADISKEFAKNSADFTTRGDIQLHWVKMKDIPEIFDRLDKVGLTTMMACGDCTRNIASCPVNGYDKNEIDDVRDLLKSVNDYFKGNSDFTNLPRKYKIGISACSCHCMKHEIQDLSFVGFRSGDEILYHVGVGGGLGSNKRFSTNIGTIKKDQVLKVAIEVTKIYRDYGNRESRNKARVGHMVESFGVEKFKEILEKNLGFKLLEPKKIVSSTKRAHFGVHDSKKEGFSYIGFSINGGVSSGDKLSQIADIMKVHNIKEAAATGSQDIVLLDIKNESVDQVIEDMKKIGLYAKPSPFRAGALACVGLAYCKFAVSETKKLQCRVIEYLEKKFPDFNEDIFISFSGCKNSCSHSNIATLGFVGTKVDKNEGFVLQVAGDINKEQKSFAKKTDVKASSNKVHLLIEEILNNYIINKDRYDGFVDYLGDRYN